MTTVRDLLQADGQSVSRPLMSVSADFIDVVAKFLRAGGDPADVEKALSAVTFMSGIHIDAAKKLRDRVLDLASVETEPFLMARCYARPKIIEETKS